MRKTERSPIFWLAAWLIMFVCITLSQVSVRALGFSALLGTVFGAAIGGIGYAYLRKLFQRRYYYQKISSEKK